MKSAATPIIRAVVASWAAIAAVAGAALKRVRRAPALLPPPALQPAGLEAEESRLLFETSLDIILITDRKGKFLRVSPSAEAIIGYRPEEMVGHCGSEFMLPQDLDRTRREMRLARLGRHMRNFDSHYVHKDGRIVPLAWSGVWSEAAGKHFFIGRDMTERKTAEEKLRRLALYDQLTGLPNRTSLHHDLDTVVGAAGAQTTIAVFDLDGFKDINDTLGHSLGDRLLKDVARRMSDVAGEARLYRLGGDEFVLVLPDCGDPLAAGEVAARVLRRLTERFELDGHSLYVAASAGIAIAPADGSSVEELVANADLALDHAKQAGGRSFRLFVPTLRARAEARRELDIELRRACAHGEFALYFQPQMRACDGSIAGAEALLRWRHPERGVLAPGTFIDALAGSAVALEVGRWILNSACTAAAEWRARGLPPFKVAVNLFPVQFRNGTLLADVEEALAASGLPADALELEITENIALDHDETMLAPLKVLRGRGVGIAFDDFGTGYASLSYLTRYPLTRIKIDRSFVCKIAAEPSSEDTAIVRSIIAMGNNLGLAVTAEGVETPAQSAFLRAQGCHELQGYLFARPLPAEAFEEFLVSCDHPAADPAAERRHG